MNDKVDSKERKIIHSHFWTYPLPEGPMQANNSPGAAYPETPDKISLVAAMLGRASAEPPGLLRVPRLLAMELLINPPPVAS